MEKKDKKYIGIMMILVLLLGIFFLCSNVLFGSKTDWLGQHTAFPEYFRNLFYQTKNLFPSFAFSIGGGQNIYNFSYYGLWNPIILFSYLLPFVPMRTYIMVTSLLGVAVSMVLLYYFLKKKLGKSLSFFSCLFYFLACPIIFHAHRHIMFVNYMPFLIWGLISIDHYFEKKKVVGLTLSVFLMILTSYYYSIGGICVFIIYGIYCWLQKNKFQWLQFLKDGILFILPILFGVLLSAFFLLPTAYALLGGRGSGTSIVDLSTLLVPNLNMSDILYNSYSLGLTSIFIFSILYLVSCKQRENRYLGVVFLLVCFIPLFIYILNGTLYVRAKSLIPFLPLAIYGIGYFLKEWIDHSKIDYLYIGLLILFHIFVWISGFHTLVYWLDVLITIVILFLSWKYHKKILLYLPLLIIAGISCIASNLTDGYVSKQYEDESISSLVQMIPDDTLWRTSIQTNTLYGINQVYDFKHLHTSLYSSVYHEDYANFYHNILDYPEPYRNRLILASANHLPAQILMGEKYMVNQCDHEYIGYTQIQQNQNLCLYESDLVYPIGFGSSKWMSQDTFEMLDYPNTLDALLHTIVVPNQETTAFESNIDETRLEGTWKLNDKLQVTKTNTGYTIDTKAKSKVVYELGEPVQGQLLLLDFDVVKESSCKDGDLEIAINGISNKLTCSSWQYKNENHHFTYILSEKNIKELEITFKKGHYEIENIHSYLWNASTVSQVDSLFPFVMDQSKTKGDQIRGTIDMKQAGYFMLTVPYDTGFHIQVDQKEVNYQKVDDTFLGFFLPEGSHQIEITYESPYSHMGKIVTILTFIGYLLYLRLQKRYQK